MLELKNASPGLPRWLAYVLIFGLFPNPLVSLASQAVLSFR